MGTMNISLPDDLKTFIDRRVAERGYGTSSEFIRELLRREQERQQLRTLILQGMASPTASRRTSSSRCRTASTSFASCTARWTLRPIGWCPSLPLRTSSAQSGIERIMTTARQVKSKAHPEAP